MLPALPIWLGLDRYWSVRVVYACVSALSIPVLGKLARRLSGPYAARLAMWALAVMPFHVYVSANGAMTEGPFLLCVLLAMHWFSGWREQIDNIRLLFGAAACIVAAESFRFDGVFVGAAFGVIALFDAWKAHRTFARPLTVWIVLSTGF